MYLVDDTFDVDDDKLSEDDDDESLLINIQVYIHIDDFENYQQHRHCFSLMENLDYYLNLQYDEEKRLMIMALRSWALIDENNNHHNNSMYWKYTMKKQILQNNSFLSNII
jgi:hypothetical protein